MQAEVKGTVLPVLEMTLQPGDKLVAESGELSWMSDAIQLGTLTQTAGAKGVLGVVKRAVAGGGIFMSEYTAQGGPGMVAFSTKLPGQILPIKVEPGPGYMVHRHGFLCGTEGVTLTMGFQKRFGAGLFGGEGFILQKVEGAGDAWIELDGEVMIYDLQPGQSLRVHPGHVGLFQEQVSFDLTTVPGIKNKVFGGDGLFLAKLTGPGRVWLQSLPISNLAAALLPYLPTQEGDSSGSVGGAAAAGIAGAAIKGIFGN